VLEGRLLPGFEMSEMGFVVEVRGMGQKVDMEDSFSRVLWYAGLGYL